MKSVCTTLAAISLFALSQTNAFAAEVDTSLTYNSGILVLAFAGFLALVVVVQTIPALTSLYHMIKKTAEETKRQEAKASARN
ncbi:MAG: hypothetical protein RBQ99_08570 [Trichlorobacter sp.]|jgi:hypothetical protein|nr:hypothetical protein [Trichlorobacter sp.]